MMQDPVNRRHRGYGFIEFETAEAAALAQEQMEGAELGGRAIRVGRPNNFPADLPPGVPRPVEGRIYVANVHEMVKEEELRMVVEAFGRVRCCHLVPDEKTGKHRGYAYIEYEDEGCANSAIFSLNNFELAKRLLKVGRTISGGPIPHGMESLKTTVIPPLNSKVPTAVLRAAQQINSGNSSASGGSINSTSPLETSVMILRNLEDYSTIAEDPEAIPELEVDVLEECSKFGPVVCCRVHLEHKDKTVTIFVKFSTAAILEEAIRVMHLRWFGGRQIIAEPYDEQRFQTEYGNQ
jgi:poly(U)-binding-splicing factor PUF60